jgi:hypothetical protein
LDTPTAAGRQFSGKTLPGTILLLGLLGAGAAGAAPCAAANCDIAARDLQAAGLPLTVRSVDLADPGTGDESDAASDVSESIAPLLFLGPRVTSILEDVFAADEMPGAAADEPGALVEDAAAQPLRSPLAETDSSSAGHAPSPETDHASILPKYQRQMYRTDI